MARGQDPEESLLRTPTSLAPATPESPKPSYNTAALPWRMLSDLTAAFCASTLVAPIITIIDKSIILRTSTPHPLPTILSSSLSSALHTPHTFLLSPPYLLVTALYFGTYTTANLTDTITATVASKPANHISAGPAKFLATSTTNMSLCIYKDARFARMFGASASPTNVGAAIKKVVPKSTLALFALRDSLTVFASFNVPPLLAPVLGSQNAAQFLAPAGVQIFSTPVHLLGLDLYNRPGGAGGKIAWGDRWGRIQRDWGGAALARMARVIPAFGVGGVVNSGVRGWLLEGV
ncbi:hypothetical protein MMC13_008130 [Lambiella insularis]|nr:hypothetical protein [Lambiella insularis]